MSFYVQHSPTVGEGILLVLAQALSAVIVDLFRILYVLSSKEAKSANMARLVYFTEMADEHMSDFQGQLARSSSSLEPETGEMFFHLERDCRWVIGQLRRRDDIVFEVSTCFSVMGRVSEKAHEAFTAIIPHQLAEAEDVVHRAYGSSVAHREHGNIQNLCLRHETQAKVLASSDARDKIRTIAHDAAQSHTLHYFLIDRLLMATY